MKNTNCKAYLDQVKTYLTDLVNDQDEDRGTPINGKPMSWIIATAKNEVPHEFDRKGLQAGLAYWLSGLGLYGLDYEYVAIIQLAETWHGCELTEKQKEMVCEKWFDHIACQIIKLARKEK